MKIFKQETNLSCGVACLRSILNDYGNNFSEKDIWDKHGPFKPKDSDKKNILSPILSLGVTALKLGYKVRYIGYHPLIANDNYSKDLKKSLQRKSKKYFDYGKYYVNTALEFLSLGGEIKIDKLNIEKLKSLVDKNKFVLVEIKPAFINNKSALRSNHKVILVGYNKKGFRVLDPKDAKERVLNFDDFLMAFYASVPEVLIIKD